MIRYTAVWHEAFFEALPNAGKGGYCLQTAAELAGVTRFAVYKAMRRNPEFKARLFAMLRADLESRRARKRHTIAYRASVA